MENEVVELYLDDIIPNRFQPREVFNDQALKELAVSIREHGVIQPIIVRKFGDKYEIIAGERRYKASTMAGLTKIPAIVRNLDDKESSKVALIENLQRRDLTPIEEARTYQKILDLDEMTQEQLAKTMGKSQSAVSNKLRLLSLPDEIQEALLKEEISERHARSLLNVNDKNTQIELLKEIISNKMTVRELDSKIKNLSGNESNDTTTSGGTTNGVVNNNNNSANNEPESLFGTEELNNMAPPINNQNSLFGNSVDNSNVSTNGMGNATEINNMGADGNMNNNGLFGGNPPMMDNSGAMQNNNMNSVPEQNNSLFGPRDTTNDPTTVDINKIREQSSDITMNVPTQSKSADDIKGLLKPEGQQEDNLSRFVPNFEDNTIEKTEDGNEVIGNGLLAGMPVIKPVDNQNGNDNNNNNPAPVNNDFGSMTAPTQPDNGSLFGATPTLNANTNDIFGNSQNVPSNDGLFGSASTLDNNMNNNSSNNDMNGLFGTPSPMTPPATNNDLFGNNNQTAVATDNVVTSNNNVQVAVEDVKNVIKSYQDKGYNVSVEELNLDNEIQLIVKFNKN